VDLQVTHQPVAQHERLLAYRADVLAYLGVDQDVGFKRVLQSECTPTDLTSMGALAGVVELVTTQGTGVGEAAPALLTVQRECASVDDLVLQLVGQLGEAAAAVRARVRRGAGVLALVDAEDSASSETTPALIT